MTLIVPYEEFPSAVEKMIGCKPIFVSESSTGCRVTAAALDKGFAIEATSSDTVEAAMASLRQAGFEPAHGRWETGVTINPESDVDSPYVAAVAYSSREARPGLWVDAFPSQPTQMQVLKALFDEFEATGEVENVDFDEFVRQADANVVIVGPGELRGFASRKEGAPQGSW